MDPVSALGIAAAIAQFVDLSTRIVKRLRDYSSTASEVPKSLQHISIQLPLLVNALDRLKTDAQVERFDIDTRCILKGAIGGCKQQVEKLDAVMDKALNVPGDSRIIKFQKALVSLRNDTKVPEIEKSLQTYIQILTLHQVVEGTAASLLAWEDDSFFEVHIRQVSPFEQRAHWMQKLEALLDPAATSQVLNPQVFYLVGKEGAGKTQLAVEYCHRARAIGHFPTTFWLNASTPQNLSRSLETISVIVRRSKEGLKDTGEKIEFVKNFLCNRWHPWLLVLDNYEPSQFKDLMGYLPSRSSGVILLITRHTTLSPVSGNIIHLPIYRDPEELKNLRRMLIRNIKKDGDVKMVSHLLAIGADPDSHDDRGLPCLYIASQRGLEPIVEILLKGGAQPRAPPFSALYEAADAGQTAVVQLLLDWEDAGGLSPQAPGNNAVLIVAAQNGYEEIVRKMVKHSSVHINGRNHREQSALGLAAENGHADIVKLLLDHGADAEAKMGEVSPIVLALKKNHLSVVRIFAAHGKFDVNKIYRMSYGKEYTPLYGYISNKKSTYPGVSIEMVKYLLDLGANPNSMGNHPLPLRAAISEREYQVVPLLLEHGADPNLSDEVNLPPLHEVARIGSTETVTALLEHGADPNALGKVTDSETYPLIEATRGGFAGIVQVLLEHGAESNALSKNFARCWGEKVYETCPLIEATRGGSTDIVSMLLEYGAKPNMLCRNAWDNIDTCPLIEATKGGFTSIVSMLLEHGADPFPVLESTSPLSEASKSGYEGILQLLLQAEVKDSKSQELQRQEALCIAAAHGQRKVIVLLLEAGADINATSNKENKSPLVLAVENGQIPTVRFLLKRGAGEGISDNDDRSPIFVATEKGLDLMVNTILLSTRRPDVHNSDGDTPLCVSAARGHEKVVEVLLKLGADRNVPNNLGDTPLDIALEHGHRSIVKLLELAVVER